MPIDTETFSARLRSKSVDLTEQRLLITRFGGSRQEQDLSEPPNCVGYGRIRHFHRSGTVGWPENPLPMDPALHKLGLARQNAMRAQVFQNASCNWRCWYCYVPFELLDANLKHSSWMSASDLLDLYAREQNAPQVIDLSGDQPDLTPEWVPWMMLELQRRQLDSTVYLWSDDNLSNATFTALDEVNISLEVATFVDRLQEINVNLPLRVVPLEVRPFAPVHERMNSRHHRAIK